MNDHYLNEVEVQEFLGYWLINSMGENYIPKQYYVDTEDFLDTLEDYRYENAVTGEQLGLLLMALANIEEDGYYAVLEYRDELYEVLEGWVNSTLSTSWASLINGYSLNTYVSCIDTNNEKNIYILTCETLSYLDTLYCTTNNRLIWKSRKVMYFTLNTILDILMNNCEIEAIEKLIRVYYKTEVVSPANTYPTFHMLIGLFNSLTEDEFENLLNNYGFENFDFQKIKMLACLGLYRD